MLCRCTGASDKGINVSILYTVSPISRWNILLNRMFLVNILTFQLIKSMIDSSEVYIYYIYYNSLRKKFHH